MTRYNAPTGKRQHVPEPQPKTPRRSPLPPTGDRVADAPEKKPPGPLRDLLGGPDGILSRLDPGRLETEDLLILAILWLLYRESGEQELLIALAAYLFL